MRYFRVLIFIIISLFLIGCDDTPKNKNGQTIIENDSKFYSEICYKELTLLQYSGGYQAGITYLRDNNDKLVPCDESIINND